jgi:hypothetical protein
MPAFNMSEYLENLVKDLDVRIDILIRDNKHDKEMVVRINVIRDEFIAEIRECEAANAEGLDTDHLASFCFFIEAVKQEKSDIDSSKWSNLLDYLGFRLVVVDSFLTRKQIVCFQEILKFTDCDYYGFKQGDLDIFFQLNDEVSPCLFFSRC